MKTDPDLIILLLGIFFLIVCFLIWLITREANFFSIQSSARRIGLRDKGNTESILEDGNHVVMKHSDCKTRTRIGIQKNKKSVEYCWRCEEIFEDDGEMNPEDPLPSKDQDDPKNSERKHLKLVSVSK